MKKFVIFSVFAAFVIASSAYAEMGDRKGGDGMGKGGDGLTIEQKKEKITVNIDKRIGLLQELKACINAAKEQSDMKKCHEKHEDAMDAMKEEMKKERRSKD